ncbi:MAG TPA: efflux transporter outer membrane subunit [Kofleriaceae bacterium]|nr:efflux transporter outer membrane subunit [Kofleriaceae bacterium]
MRRLAAFAVGLTCCTLAPRYERPAAPVGNQFPGQGGTLAAADQGWRTMFGDPRLQVLISLALANNRDLRIAALQVEQTRAEYGIERSALLPTVSAAADAQIYSHDAKIPSQYRVGASASYELDLFGRVRSLKNAALEQYLASEEARRAAHLALVAEVVNQYLRQRAYDEERAVAEQTLGLVEQFAELTRRMLDAGNRSELDVRTAEAQVAAARAEVARLRRLAAQAQNALVLLIGQPLPANLPPAQPLEAETMIADLGAGVPSEVLLRRPDVLAAEHALRAANANIGAARAAFFPAISLTGFAGLASTALSGLFSGSIAWTFAPSITMPLFTGGKNTANLDLAHARKRIEVARYEKAIQVAFREVADALVARAYFDEQLAAQTEQTAAEQARFELSDQRYRTGIESYLVVIAAQQDLYTAQQQLIEVRLARLQNLADLYRALGGGWRER